MTTALLNLTQHITQVQPSIAPCNLDMLVLTVVRQTFLRLVMWSSDVELLLVERELMAQASSASCHHFVSLPEGGHSQVSTTDAR